MADKNMNWSNYGKWRHPKEWNKLKTNNMSKKELIIESILIGIATGVAVMILSTAAVIFWNVGKAIWTTLIK